MFIIGAASIKGVFAAVHFGECLASASVVVAVAVVFLCRFFVCTALDKQRKFVSNRTETHHQKKRKREGTQHKADEGRARSGNAAGGHKQQQRNVKGKGEKRNASGLAHCGRLSINFH